MPFVGNFRLYPGLVVCGEVLVEVWSKVLVEVLVEVCGEVLG